MPHWSRDVQPPMSRLRRNGYTCAPPDGGSNVPKWQVRCPPGVEEHYPRRRRSSIGTEVRFDPVVEEHRPRRWSRSNSSNSNIDDHPRHCRPQPRPIILPPMPSRHRQRSTRKKLYFVRPHDGHPERRRGTFGRLKDALTGAGPDVFITSSTSDRMMRDRPQRWQWSGYGLDSDEILMKIIEPGFAWSELEPVRETPWAGRGSMEGYDFRTRRYGGLDKEVWTDAPWPADARKGSWPARYRDEKLRW